MSSFWKQVLMILGKWLLGGRVLILETKDLKNLQDILRVEFDLSLNYDGIVPLNYLGSTKYPYCDKWGVPIESQRTKEAHELYWKLQEQIEAMK